MRIRNSLVFGVFSVLAVLTAPHAQAGDQDFLAQYLTISEIEVAELDDQGNELSIAVDRQVGLRATARNAQPMGDGDWIGNVDDALVIFDKIINLGTKIFDIIKANKAVVNIQRDYATAVPQGITHWTDLETWSIPQTKVYKIAYKNAYGMTVCSFKWRVHYTHSGSLDGIGHYLTGITVSVAELVTAWGFTFNMKASIPSVTNAGTRKNPVGQAEILVEWNISGANQLDQSTSYIVRGDGTFVDITNGN